jgi:hypothetical protein
MKINKNLPKKLNIFIQYAEVWQKPQHNLNLALDWLDIFISPSGLLSINFGLLLSCL